jgi:ribosomal protein L30/L7E
MTSLDEQLRFAIANKRLLCVTYNGVMRAGEPHDYGIQNGTPKLLFYQLRRASNNRLWKATAVWRLLEISKIESCVVMEETFPGSRGSSHRQHLTWDELFVRVT